MSRVATNGGVYAEPAVLRSLSGIIDGDVNIAVVSAEGRLSSVGGHASPDMRTDSQLTVFASCWPRLVTDLSSALSGFSDKVRTAADNFDRAGNGGVPNGFAPRTRK